jgi:nicotinamidase/pyrazinamidase
MTSFAFMDCDTQVDFLSPAGALRVPGGEAIVPNVVRLLDAARAHGATVLSVVDSHLENDPEFGEWPPHCVAGTPGARKLPETCWDDPIVIPNRPLPVAIRPGAQIVVEKRIHGVFDNVNVEVLLRRIAVRAWVVFGVPAEFGVKAAVLGLLERGYGARVVTDAVRGMTPEGEQAALSELSAAGAKFVTTDEVLAALPAEDARSWALV